MTYGPNNPQYAPQPPRPKRKAGKIAAFGCGSIVVLAIFGGCMAAITSSSNDSKSSASDGKSTSSAASKSSDQPKDTGNVKPPATEAEQFKGCINKNGTATERKAAGHITKVTGSGTRNDVLDAPEVFTDFSGGLMGPHQGEGKLIASAFASCYESDNGLVTVYDKDGEILANGKF